MDFTLRLQRVKGLVSPAQWNSLRTTCNVSLSARSSHSSETAMPLRLCMMALLASASCFVRAAEAPAIVRTERPVLLSKEDDLFRIPPTQDCFFTLVIEIDPEGRVSNVEVADRGFADRKQIAGAIDYVKRYRFKPATRAGVAVESRVRQSFSVNTGENRPISTQFRDESRKVVSLISEGDAKGASFHAEWMLSEVVRTRHEYLALQGNMAVALANASEPHRAIVALRAALARTRPAPELDLAAATPRNASSNYQFDNRDYITNLLDLKLRLTVRQGLHREAMQAYQELAGLIPLKADDPRVLIARQLSAALQSTQELVGKVSLVPSPFTESGWWTHRLHRRSFTLDQVEGTVKDISLSCDGESRDIAYSEGVEWSVPAGWENCQITIEGDLGTTFQIMEFATGA